MSGNKLLHFFKTKPSLRGLGLFIFICLLGTFSQIKSAEAFSQVCEPWGASPTHTCFAVPDGTAVFPPGTIAPAAGSPFDQNWVPTIPTADTTLAAWPIPNPPLYPLVPAAGIGGSYGAGPYYGVNIVPGWTGISNPPSALYGGSAPFPSIIAYPGILPTMPTQPSCGWPVFACGALQNSQLSSWPIDPIIFLGDGTARMVPIGTQVIKPALGSVVPLGQQGAVSGHSPVTIVAGDYVVPPPTHTGCPRVYAADGSFTCVTYADIAALIAQIGPPPGVTPPPPPAAAGLLPAACNIASAVLSLTGSFGADPCDLTETLAGFGFALNFEGGEKFSNELTDWWNNTMLPDMRDMTDQWNVAIIDETRIVGDAKGAQMQNENALNTSQQEYEATKRLRPSENTCSMASIAQGVQKSLQTTHAVKTALLTESASRGLGLPGSGVEEGAGFDQNTRWTNYCNIFADPNDNAGTSGCPAAGTIPGADVSVERFLFRDTINTMDPDQRTAADAILRNLVDLKVMPPMPTGAITTQAGETSILRRNHYATLRQAVVEPVAGIIARRTAIPNSGYEISIRDMRTAAGIPLAEVAASPSYNEAMLARSKEYFMNLDTLMKTGNDIGEIRQDQVVNEALIAMTLKDIEELEAQINTILQARSSMKFNEHEASQGVRHQSRPRR